MPVRWEIGDGIGSGEDGTWRSVRLPDSHVECFVVLSDGSEVPWDEAPEVGVQVVVTTYPTGIAIDHGFDEYIRGGESKYGVMMNLAAHKRILRNTRARWQSPTT